MPPQDHDGSHIKGLVINFLHHFWPSLLALPGFLREFITPIVKVRKRTLAAVVHAVWGKKEKKWVVSDGFVCAKARASSPPPSGMPP